MKWKQKSQGMRALADSWNCHQDDAMIAMDEIIVPAPEPDEVVDPLGWFRTPGRFELEIGCGKGGFLLSRARTAPDVRLLGVEWANKYFRFAADRIARWGVTNVRVMRADAGILVTRNLPANCVHVLHLYHPDPWPKKRHHKRRLVQAEFIDAVARVLVENGQWRIQSDHREYFGEMVETIGRCQRLTAIDWADDSQLAGPQWGGTNFEVKYSREGRPIYRTAFQKRA